MEFHAQWLNGRAEAVVKSTKHALRTTFKDTTMDSMDFLTTLKSIAGLLNSRPVELMLGAYKSDGGGQEMDSLLPSRQSHLMTSLLAVELPAVQKPTLT